MGGDLLRTSIPQTGRGAKTDLHGAAESLSLSAPLASTVGHRAGCMRTSRPAGKDKETRARPLNRRKRCYRWNNGARCKSRDILTPSHLLPADFPEEAEITVSAGEHLTGRDVSCWSGGGANHGVRARAFDPTDQAFPPRSTGRDSGR